MSLLKSHFSVFVFLLLFMPLFHNYSSSSSSITAVGSNDTDHLALLAIKAQITSDPMQFTNSWNQSLHFCQWKGISCSKRHKTRVVGLNFVSWNLFGSLSPSIGNLSFLKTLQLSNNYFHGEIPNEIGQLLRLQNMALWNNSFGGRIPASISFCSKLRVLHLDHNKFEGQLPMELGSLSMLLQLVADTNIFTGKIPASFGNLSSLEDLFLVENMLEGSIPYSLGQLKSLKYLALSSNQLSEYGMGSEVSKYGDVYSFGILLLEMFTGKRPTDDMFRDGLNLHKATETALPDQVMEFVDQIMLFGVDRDESEEIKKGLVSILKIGVACSKEAPRERMKIFDAAIELKSIKDMVFVNRISI